MKKIYIFSFLVASALSFGQQAPPFYEGFDYTATQALQTQSGYTALNTGDDILIASGNLTYAGLAASTGNKISFSGAGIDTGRDFANVSSNTIYYSFLLNVTDLTATTSTTGGYFAGLVQGTSSSFGSTLWIKKIDANTFNLGVNTRTTAANTVYAPLAYNINETYLVVVSYTFNSAAADDVSKIWVNPTIGGTEPANVGTATNTAGTDLTGIARFLIRQGSATDTPNVEMDELRIATNWNDATTTTVALGVKENSISGLSIYPNPVTGKTFTVNTANNSDITVAIYDVIGKQVLNTKVSNNTVNVANLNAGVYIVKITEEGKTATRKLVIQ